MSLTEFLSSCSLSPYFFNLGELAHFLGLQSNADLPPESDPESFVKSTPGCSKELKAKTDLSFKFEKIKNGRKVADIKFTIHSKKLSGDSSELKIPSLNFEQERELAIQAKKILETMTPEELQDIEMTAIPNLPPEMKKMALKNRMTAQFAITRAMEKVVIERYLQNAESTMEQS